MYPPKGWRPVRVESIHPYLRREPRREPTPEEVKLNWSDFRKIVVSGGIASG